MEGPGQSLGYDNKDLKDVREEL